MATVTVEDMKSRLLTMDQVRERLSITEPLSTDIVTADSKVKFQFDAAWEQELDALDNTDLVGGSMTIAGTESRLTKEAVYQAAAIAHVPVSLVKSTPAHLIEGLLNYHFNAGIKNEQKVLIVKDNIAAFTRPTVVPFSNLALLDHALDGIRHRYGADVEVLGDYKIHNSLSQTDVRLIVPEHERTINDSGLGDIPTGEGDRWSAGIHLVNSFTGKKQTALEAYLFRWWCTNGATTRLDEAGTWSRRANIGAAEQEVYEWARASVDDVLGGLEHRFDEIQALTMLNVTGASTADVLREIFATYEVPVSQRDTIRDTLLGSERLTMYTIMNAITQAANDPDLDGRRADRLMRIGGEIPTAVFDTLKARVWREGHSAEAQAVNPYEIVHVLNQADQQ